MRGQSTSVVHEKKKVTFIQRFLRVSSRPRNGRGMRQNSSPRLVLDLEKQGSKVLSLKWQRKRPKFRGIPRLVLEKAEEKGKIPRLVLGKILPKVSTSSSLDEPSRTSALCPHMLLCEILGVVPVLKQGSADCFPFELQVFQLFDVRRKDTPYCNVPKTYAKKEKNPRNEKASECCCLVNRADKMK